MIILDDLAAHEVRTALSEAKALAALMGEQQLAARLATARRLCTTEEQAAREDDMRARAGAAPAPTCSDCDKPARGWVREDGGVPEHMCRQCADHCATARYIARRW